MENYHNPEWWDEWLKKNYKKQIRLLYQRDTHMRSGAAYLSFIPAIWNLLIR